MCLRRRIQPDGSSLKRHLLAIGLLSIAYFHAGLRVVGSEDLLVCVFLVSKRIDYLLFKALIREQGFSESRGCQGIREEKGNNDRKGT